MNTKSHKLAIAVLALSLTQAASASEPTFSDDHDNTHTYWGVGIGSVLGAVIAGPPGAAIGATLGGSLGWGKDQNEALDESLSVRETQALSLQKNSDILEKHRRALRQTEQEILSLKRDNTLKASRLRELEAVKNNSEVDSDFLKKLANHYTQDIYFQSGQYETPNYSKDRLANLVELLKTYPDLRVTLKGYTDSSGSKQLNEKLAQARVNSIKKALSKQGIDEARLTGIAVGEVDHLNPQKVDSNKETLSETSLSEIQSPIETEISPKAHVLDRRVSIELSVADMAVADDSTKNIPDIVDLAVLEQ